MTSGPCTPCRPMPKYERSCGSATDSCSAPCALHGTLARQRLPRRSFQGLRRCRQPYWSPLCNSWTVWDPLLSRSCIR